MRVVRKEAHEPGFCKGHDSLPLGSFECLLIYKASVAEQLLIYNTIFHHHRFEWSGYIEIVFENLWFSEVGEMRAMRIVGWDWVEDFFVALEIRLGCPDKRMCIYTTMSSFKSIFVALFLVGKSLVSLGDFLCYIFIHSIQPHIKVQKQVNRQKQKQTNLQQHLKPSFSKKVRNP